MSGAWANRMAWVMAVVLCVTSAVWAEVYTVDDDGPADFTDLTTAMAAVSDGDTLLVMGGEYDVLDINNVSVSVIAVPGETVRVAHLGVADLAPHQSVYIRGLTLVGGATNEGMLSCLRCRGNLWFDQVEVEPLPINWVPGPGGSAGEACLFLRCDFVLMTGCTLRGHDAAPLVFGPVAAGGALLLLQGSNLILHDTVVTGGTGTDGYLEAVFSEPLPGDPGARGVWVQDSRLHMAGSSLTGGHGGDGLFGPPCSAGGAAGDGVLLHGPGARAEFLSTPVAAGSLGQGGAGCLAGTAGQDVVLDDGAVAEALAGTARALTLDGLAAPGDELTLGLEHGAEESWLLVVGLQPALVPAPSILGPVVVNPLVILALDPFGQSGTTELELIAPQLPAGLRTLELFVQGVAFPAVGMPVASSPARLTVIDLQSHLP